MRPRGTSSPARRLVLALCAALAVAVASPAGAAADDSRYTIANGCFGLKSVSAGKYVAKSGGGYSADQSAIGGAEPLRLKATELGMYMLYGKGGDFLASDGSKAVTQPAPDAQADWRVQGSNPEFRIDLPSANKELAVDASGALVLADPGSSGDRGLFAFDAAEGCATFPEVDTNVDGAPSTGPIPFGETSGLVDAHMHMMAFRFLGGKLHCGKPWDRYGVTVALVDCPDHQGNGAGAAVENTLSYGNPARTHDPVGWPTFKDWPAAQSLTHELSYYKWLERTWRSGLRVYVNLLVDNAQLCEVYPLRAEGNDCNEMNTVRREARDLYDLENYIDAQSGGPGKGWFRIVKTPFEARKVINEGKLAVVMGIEISKLFDCGIYNDTPDQGCDTKQIDSQLDEVYRMGVRDMELINKFDNAFGGVAGDGGQTGIVVNNANKRETNAYWAMQTCPSQFDPNAHDREQTTAPGSGQDQLFGAVAAQYIPLGTAPIYPAAPHCNARGLTPLGVHLVERMMEKKMIIDPDHLSVRARDHLLSVVEAKKYSGIVSSHSWSTLDAMPRIYNLGGFVTPYAGDSTSFVKAWQATKPLRNNKFLFGFGWGADANGFGPQGDPRGEGAPNPVTYPFKSWDGKQTVHQQKSGERLFDINKEGVAHYGLYADWVEDLRKLAGQEIIDDLGRGSEAYLQMWERADGVPATSCVQSRVTFSRKGFTRMRLGDTPERLLRRAGQPQTRTRAWDYCSGRGDGGKVTPVFTEGGRVSLIASRARFHRAAGIGPGARARRLRGRAKSFGRGVMVRNAGRGVKYVYGVSKGRVTYVGVASKATGKSRAALKRDLKLAGL